MKNHHNRSIISIETLEQQDKDKQNVLSLPQANKAASGTATPIIQADARALQYASVLGGLAPWEK